MASFYQSMDSVLVHSMTLLASVVEFCPEAWDEQELSFIEVVSLLQSG